MANYRQVGEIVLEEKPVIWGPKQLSPTSCLGKQESKDDIRLLLLPSKQLPGAAVLNICPLRLEPLATEITIWTFKSNQWPSVDDI